MQEDPLEPGGLTPKHLRPQRAWTGNIPDHLREALPSARGVIRIESPKEVRIHCVAWWIGVFEGHPFKNITSWEDCTWQDLEPMHALFCVFLHCLL
jgi:hypothetical protein